MSSRPEYSYRLKGALWAVYRWKEDGNVRTGDKVAEFRTREEARKECYRLNGWKYKEEKA